MKVNQGCLSHIGRRKNQQDAYGFSDFNDSLFIEHGGVLAVVCDGIGGMEKGEEASNLAVKVVLDNYMSKSAKKSVTEALDRVVAMANKAVIQLGVQSGNEDNVGSTLAVAVIQQDELFWRTAGDSRIYLLRRDNLTQLNSDHTYARQRTLEQGELTLEHEGQAKHPYDDALVSYLGVGEGIEVDKNELPLKLQADDVLLICSDGVYNSLSEAEIIDSLQHHDPMKAALALQHQIIDKQFIHQDNLTAIVLRIQAEDVMSRPFISLHARKSYILSLCIVSISAGVLVGLKMLGWIVF